MRVKTLPSGRFAFIDALRGLAALSVVLFHAKEGDHIPYMFSEMPGWIAALIENGYLGIAIFFVLSGFVISHSIYAERVSVRFVGRFMLRRSLRLDPPYWTAIVLSLGFAFLSAKIVPDKVSPHVSPGQFMAHLVYLQDILGYPAINAVFWTLCLEVQFYLIYVVLLAIGRNDPDAPMQGRGVIVLFGTAAVISLLWPMGLVTSGLWPGSFLPLWHAFLLGVGAYWSWRNPAAVPFFVAYVLAVAIPSIFRGHIFSIACVVMACVILAAAMTGQIFTALSWSWLQFLGAISYSLYLTHNPITGASFRIIYMLTGPTPAWEPVAWIMSLSACIVFAAATWWLIEKPSTRLSRKLRLSGAAQHQHSAEAADHAVKS
jgi:peptidoglycan/LPS O-acetylase OafA/YrhL